MLLRTVLFVVFIAGLALASPYPQNAGSAVPGPSRTLCSRQLRDRWVPSKSLLSKGTQTTATGGPVRTGSNSVSSINNDDGVGPGSDSYKQYTGDGSLSAGWPASSQWVSFDNMFNSNKPLMFSSCSNTYSQVDDSGPEVGAIYDAIQSAATSTSIDPRFILAVIMQESGGCVRAPTSNYGVRNPGLMQDHNGAGTCNDNGQVQNPCPTATVRQMISEGTAGTADGDGLAQGIGKAGAGDVSAFYKAARIYNSGTVDPSGDLGKGIATHCYASDIANRLTGWVMAPHGCNL